MMRTSENERAKFLPRLGVSAAAAIAGLLLSIAAAVVAAFILSFTGTDYESAATPISIICAAVGALLSGFFAARKIGSGGITSGLLTGAVFLIAAIILGCVVSMQPPNIFADWTGYVMCAVVLILSAAGGIAGVNLGSARR